MPFNPFSKRSNKRTRSRFADKKEAFLDKYREHAKFVSKQSKKTARSYLKQPLTAKQKKNLVGVVLFIIGIFVMAYFIADPLKQFLTDPSEFQQFAAKNPIPAAFLLIGIMMLQIVIAVIPGEPVQLAAGYAFGALWGTILALAGTVVGSIIVFMLVKRYGRVLVDLFFSQEKMQEISFIHDSKRLNTLVFILMFIPGTPKDLITYVIGLTPMKLRTWLLISTPARTPALLASTIAGSQFNQGNMHLTIIILIITGLLAFLGIVYYAYLTKQARDKKRMDKMHEQYKRRQSQG